MDFFWLKDKRDFEQVYKNGRTIISSNRKIKATYFIEPQTEKRKTIFGISIISKKGNSVWRNRLKRVLREAIKTETLQIQKAAIENSISLSVIFSPYSIDQKNSRKIFLKEINISVQDILNRMISTLT